MFPGFALGTAARARTRLHPKCRLEVQSLHSAPRRCPPLLCSFVFFKVLQTSSAAPAQVRGAASPSGGSDASRGGGCARERERARRRPELPRAPARSNHEGPHDGLLQWAARESRQVLMADHQGLKTVLRSLSACRRLSRIVWSKICLLDFGEGGK